MLLIPFDADYTHPAAPRARRARGLHRSLWPPPTEAFVASLRELLGVIGAHEWRRKGVVIPALDERIHPWYGVFSPVRGEYVELVAQAPLPPRARRWPSTSAPAPACWRRCWRGAACERVVATDMDERALGCARANIERLGLARPGRGGAGRPVPGRPRRPGGLQSALAAGQAQFGHRIRDLRSGQPHAARLPGRPGGPPAATAAKAG